MAKIEKNSYQHEAGWFDINRLKSEDQQRSITIGKQGMGKHFGSLAEKKCAAHNVLNKKDGGKF